MTKLPIDSDEKSSLDSGRTADKNRQIIDIIADSEKVARDHIYDTDEIEKLKKELCNYQRLTSNINEFLWSSEIENSQENIFYSSSVARLTGYEEEEIKALPGRGQSLILAEDAFNIRKKINDFENDRTQDSIELVYRISTKQNEILWVKENIRVQRNPLGKITRFDGTVTNISALKKEEEILREAVNNLTSLNDAKDRFISIISHDLRAPFTSILGFAEILMNEEALPEAERNEYLNYIYESSQSQLQLVNYMLDWSRLQTGRLKIEPQRLKAKSIVYNCVSALTGNAMRKNIEIKLNIQEDIFIQADEKLITQAVTNLLSNAIKFTEEKKSIELSVTPFKEGFVEFVVKDEGIGISEANKRKIFKFDQKFSSEGTRGEKGTGLGLTLVKEIVEKHGGDIWFYSEPNHGSEFHFIIPEADNIVLLVEDDMASRLVCHKLITRTLPNFKVILASNGYEAMSIILDKVPTLVISDHNMPLMNGIQLIESMRKREESNKIPVIIIAALLSDELREKYEHLGVESFLKKPLDHKEFATLLQEILV